MAVSLIKKKCNYCYLRYTTLHTKNSLFSPFAKIFPIYEQFFNTRTRLNHLLVCNRVKKDKDPDEGTATKSLTLKLVQTNVQGI